MARDDRKRRFVLLIAGLSPLLLGATAFFWRQQLLLEWHRRHAVKDCHDPQFDPREPTASWKKIIASGEEGFPVLARLLRAGDGRVWTSTVFMVDRHLGPGRRESLLAYLRSWDRLSLVRYLIVEPYDEESAWRGDGLPGPGRDSDPYRYWSGREGHPLPPSPAAIRFCGHVLENGMAFASTESCQRVLKQRALQALGAQLAAGDLGDVRAADGGSGNLRARVAAVLAATARRDPDPDLRLEALNLLALRAGLSQHRRLPSLAEWESACPQSPGAIGAGILESAADPVGAVFADPAAISPLAHLDHPKALRILLRLDRIPRLKKKLDAVLSGGFPLPVALPQWRPFSQAARRLLEGTDDDRRIAALCLAELNERGSVPALADLHAGETDPELRLLYGSCLLALGDDRARESVEAEFEKRLKKGTSFTLVIPDRCWPFSFALEEKPLSIPGKVSFVNLGPSQTQEYYFLQADPQKLDTTTLAAHLLWSGEPRYLTRLVEILVSCDPLPFPVAGQPPDLKYSSFVEGFPIETLAGLFVVPSLVPLDSSSDLRLVVPPPVKGTESQPSSNASKAQKELAEWWKANKDRLTWDPARRRWRLSALQRQSGSEPSPSAASATGLPRG